MTSFCDMKEFDILAPPLPLRGDNDVDDLLVRTGVPVALRAVPIGLGKMTI